MYLLLLIIRVLMMPNELKLTYIMRRFFLILALVLTVGSTFAANGTAFFPSETCLYADGICNDVAGSDSSQFTVYVEGARLYTTCVPDGSVLSIYSITGQRIGSYVVIDNYVDLGDVLPKGIYIIRVNNHSAKITIRG